MTSLHSKRLVLRPWRYEDKIPYAHMNDNPLVREHFPSLLSKEESDLEAERLSLHIDATGWGLWAVEIPEIAAFAGFIGLSEVRFSEHFTPAIEVGWRLDPTYWGKGYATEGARLALRYGFEVLELPEIISFTTRANTRSRRVMERLEMTYDPKDDFEHPLLPEGSPQRSHVLYRLRAPKRASIH